MILAVLQQRGRHRRAGDLRHLHRDGGRGAADRARRGSGAGAGAGLGRVERAAAGEGVVAIGEVGLAGEVRPVTGARRRLTEAARLGFTTALVPPDPDGKDYGGNLRAVDRRSGRRPGSASRRGRPARAGKAEPLQAVCSGLARPRRSGTRGACRVRRPPVQNTESRRESHSAGEASERAALSAILSTVAPGTVLRDGLERILRGNTGGLVVFGFDKLVDEMSTGGFVLDVEFSPQRLRELCKMDGAVVVYQRRLPHRARRRAVGPGRGDPHRGDRHPAPHRRPRRQADRLPGASRCRSRCASSRCMCAASATFWRTPARSCPRRTRRWPPWSATNCAWTRSPEPCRRWRSRTW